MAASYQLRRAVTYPFRLGPPGEDWLDTRFGVLALVNNLSSAGDALVAVALAGSVFVSVPLHAARGRTALGLLCTMLPFAVVAPLTGPFADRVRRGKGMVVLLAAVGRLAAVVMMAAWIHNLLLFPAAFVALVCSKTHAVARASLVPSVVSGEAELVPANSKLAVGSGVASAVAAGVGGLIYLAGHSRAVLDFDVFVFAVVAALSLQLLALKPSPAGDAPAKDGPRTPMPLPIKRAALVMGGIRAAAGFLTAVVVFGFRVQKAPAIWYGVVALGAVAGSLLGALLAPRARRLVRREMWLVFNACLFTAAAAGLVAALPDPHHRLGALLLSVLAGVSGSVARASFDAMAQEQVPEASRASTFARLEASFQTVWVLSALIPTVFAVPLRAGFVAIAVILITLAAAVRLADLAN